MAQSNPYHRERVQIRQAVAKGDVPTTRELFETVWANFLDDIEQEWRDEHSTLTKELLAADPSQTRKLVGEFIAKRFDSAARRFLFPDIEDPEGYFRLLDFFVSAKFIRCDELALCIGGKEAIHILLDGRRSHWRSEAMKLARANVAKKSSPRGLIEAYMARQGIPTIDGKDDGFLTKFTKMNRDTLFAIRDETRWVKVINYKELADFIGCRPEQLHPRDLPRPQRNSKR